MRAGVGSLTGVESAQPSRSIRIARRLWAGPASLAGVLLSPFFHTRRVIDGVLVCEGASWPGRLGWPFRAITFGHVVLSVDALDDATLRHELVHVRQYEALGVFFIPAYLLASLWALARRRHFYRENLFEAAARRNDRHLEEEER